MVNDYLKGWAYQFFLYRKQINDQYLSQLIYRYVQHFQNRKYFALLIFRLIYYLRLYPRHLEKPLRPLTTPMDFIAFQQPSSTDSTAISICADKAKLHQLAASIMTYNKIEQVSTYESFLRQDAALPQILENLCTSKEVYFVTSQLLLRMLKKSSFNELSFKITHSLLMNISHSFSGQQFKNRIIKFYRLIQNKYLQVITQNLSSLQKHEYNQAIQILTHTLSELLNVCSEEEIPHTSFINILFPSYFEAKKMTGFSMLQFVTDQQPFNCPNDKDVIFPSNVELYKILMNVMAQVIEMKENWEEEKYSESEYKTNHRKFRNRFAQDWVEFAIKQTKMVFHLYLSQEKILFSHIVLSDVIKLLNQVLLFSYQNPKNYHEVERPMYVKSPQYSFPEGILKQIGEDNTFLEVLHQVHTKVVLLRQDNAVKNGQVDVDYSLAEDKVIEVCEKIFGIYGRMFFVTTEYERNKVKDSLLMETTQASEVPRYLSLHLTKVSILSQILQNPLQYLCHFNQSPKQQTINTKQRYNLTYALVQIISQFIIYSRCIDQPHTLSPVSKTDQLKLQIRYKMRLFIVQVVGFANEYCLQSECWKMMFGVGEGIGKEEVFTEVRHCELFFAHKVFEMLYQCHQTIDFKFYNPLTEGELIKFFYQRYFQIADQFLGKFQGEFTNKISLLIRDDFHLEYSMLKQIFRAMPYVKIKEDKVLRLPAEYRPHDLQFVQEHYEPERNEDGQKVLDYFEKFDELITNVCCTIQAKLEAGQAINKKENLTFFYYLIATLLEHYLKNSNFYTKVSQPLIVAIKLLLRIAFDGDRINSAPSVFAFYEQIVSILSEKSLNCRQLVDIVFETEEEAMEMKQNQLQYPNLEQKSMLYEFKNKPARQRSLQMVKTLMKSTCQRLITTDAKELDAALIVLAAILKDFALNPFVQEFRYMKYFIQNYMNSPASIFSQRINNQRKMKVIELTAEFMQIKANDFSQRQMSQFLIELNNSFIAPFLQQKNISTLLAYFRCIQQLLITNHNNKLFIIDVFLVTIQPFIKEINKDYRKHISSNVDFYQTTKSLLHSILEVVELFGGGKWGTKHRQNQADHSPTLKMSKSVGSYSGDEFGLDRSLIEGWEINERDNELALIVEEYFYTWLKELGREDYETENSSTWSREKQQANDKQITLIYLQFINLTPNGKLPPLPKALVQKQRNTHLCAQLQRSAKVSQQIHTLQQVTTKQTKTTRDMVRLYLQHLYRLSDTNLLALYPSIDYRLQYVRKWWQEVMIRGLKPEMNVGYVYAKFVMRGMTLARYEVNRQLAEMLFRIANYYKGDQEYVAKFLQETYRIRSMVLQSENSLVGTGNNTGFQFVVNSGNTKLKQQLIYEDRKYYVNRMLEFWSSNP